MVKAKKNREVSAADVLRYAKGLLAKPGGWTQKVYARDSKGNEVDDKSPEACSFCVMGAFFRAQQYLHPLQSMIYRASDALYLATDYAPMEFNDKQTTKRPVIAALSRAIKKLEAKHA